MKMKRALAMLLATAMVVTAVPQTAYATELQDGEADAAETEITEQSGSDGSGEAVAETEEPGSEDAEDSEIEEAETTGSDGSGEASTETETSGGETAWDEETETEVTEDTEADGDAEETETSEEEVVEDTEEETEVSEQSARSVVEEYTFLTDGQTLHHTDYNSEEYVFAPEKSGFYYLNAKSTTDCLFIFGVDRVLYYTEQDGTQVENTYHLSWYDVDEETNNLSTDTEYDKIVWLNEDEKYIFSCNPMSYSDRNDIDIELTVQYAGDLESVEVVQEPSESSYDCLDLSGMQAKLTFAEGIEVVSDVTCDITYGAEQNNSNNALSVFNWYAVAYDKTAAINGDIEITSIDGEADYDLAALEDGTHQAGLEIFSYTFDDDDVMLEDQQFAFETEFEMQKSNVASIEVVDAQTEYTENYNYNEKLQPATIRVTYNDGTAAETMTTGKAGVSQYLEYTSDDGQSTYRTSDITTYLENGGSTGTAEVWIAYKGVKTSYEITIEECSYEKIEIQPKKTIYYSGCSYQDETGSGSGDWIEQSDFSATVYSKDGQEESYDSLWDLPSENGYGSLGISYTDEDGNTYCYQYIDDYIAAGGTTGTQQVTFKWMGLEATAEIEIAKNPYDHIKLAVEPTKKSYVYNSDDSLSLGGMEIYAYRDEEETESNYDVYSYGSSAGAIEDWMNYLYTTLGGHNAVSYLEIGTHTVSVFFMGKKATYEIEVAEKLAESLEITQAPSKISFYEGEKDEYTYIDWTGLELAITDLDGNVNKYLYNEDEKDGYGSWSDINADLTIDSSEVDWDTVGTYTVSVSYLGVSDSFEVSITESPVLSIEILQTPDKMLYYQYENYSIDLEGMKYQVNYTDGTSEEYTIDYQRSNIFGYYQDTYYYGSTEWKRIGSTGTPTLGDNALVLSFLGKTCQIDGVTVESNPVKSLKLVSNPDKMAYLQREWKVDLYGAEFVITYADGTTRDVTVDEHTNDFSVDDAYEGILEGRLCYYNGEERDRIIVYSYFNGTCETEMQLDLSTMGAIPLTNETQVETTLINDGLINDSPYQIYSFMPETTGTYCFYTLGDVDTYAELYQENQILIGASDRNEYYDYDKEEDCSSDYDDDEYGYDNNCYIEKELTAGVQYYYVVYTQSSDYCEENGEAVFLSCLSSTDIKDMNVASFEVTKVRKDTWYTFESNRIYLDEDDNYNLYGTDIQVTYENGWTQTYTVSKYRDSVMINGRKLSAVWKYTTTDEDGDTYVEIRDDNAIVFTYGDETAEVPVSFNVESPVESLEMTANPFDDKNIYEYEINNCQNKLGGMKVTVHYKDGREDAVLAWTYDEETGEVSDPCLDGYYADVDIAEIYDTEGESTGNYSLTVQYMGASVSDAVTVQPNPVTDIKILSTPDVMAYFPYEQESSAIDLYGLKAVISFRNGTTQTIEIQTHGKSVLIDNDYGQSITGSISEIYDDETDEESRLLYVSYLGYSKMVGTYGVRSFDELGELEQLVPDAIATVELDDTNRYKVFSVKAADTGDYTFASEGEYDTYAQLYSASGSKLESDDDGGSDSNFALTYNLIAGKTYYLVARMYSVGTSGTFTCSMSKSSGTQKENIESVAVSYEDPQAGEEFPELDEIDGSECYVWSCSWLEDDEDDGYVDYGTAHRVKVVLQPRSGYCFTSSTKLTVNGRRITEKSVGTDGRMTFYYTFPYTACRVTVPHVEGYETDLSQNADPNSAAYGADYKFRYIRDEDNTDATELIVKANDTILTADEDGYYCIENVKQNITVFVKTENVAIDSSVESKLTLHNQSEKVYDIMTGRKNHTIADNESGETTLPVLESYVDGSDQFFYGWYQNKNDNLNGTGGRFTSRTVLTNPEYDLYAKWASGFFTNVLNGKEVHYKILTIDENNRTKVQVGDGVNKTVQSASAFSRIMAYAAGTSDVLVIPDSISVNDTDLADLGIDWGECQVVAIAENAFAGETGITSVTLPNTIESIGANAFDGCTDLQEIVIPESVSEIGAGAFNDCSSLESVTIEEGVTTIGANAFAGCTSLSTVVLPDTLENVDEDAFTSDSENLTIICSTELADTDIINSIKDKTGATVQTVDISVDYAYDEMQFTYGDGAQSFAASVAVDGVEDEERQLQWTYTDTDAYKFDVDGNGITVTPLRATTDEENILITVTDEQSQKTKTITLGTEQLDLAADDADGDALFTVEVKNSTKFSYTGKPICPDVIVKRAYTESIVPSDGYEVTYDNNTDAGDVTVVVSGKGNYTGTLYTKFAIAKKPQSITAQNVTRKMGDAAFSIAAKTDGGGALTYSSSNTKVATVDKTGTVSIVGAGTATITIKAAGTKNYEASEKQITISVNKGTQTITAQNVTKKVGDAAFKLGAKTSGNGTLTYASSNTKVATVDASGTVSIKGAGTATITVKAAATANYASAEKKVTVTVEKADAQLKVKKTSYNKVMGNKAFSLGASAKSAVKYKSSNKKVVTVSSAGKVTIKGCGKATITVSAGDSNYKSATKKITIKVVPKTAKIKSLSSKKAGQLTVTWTKQKEAKGYVIEYSTDKKFAKNVKTVTVSKNSKTSTTLKKLSKGKKYYVRVKAYTTIDKKKACGKASKALKKAVKK